MANIPVCTSFMKNGGTGPPWSPWFRRPCKCSGSICTDIFKNSSPNMVNKYTESTLSVYKLTDINFSQFMYWLLNEYPSVYLLAIKSISVSLCTGYYTNWLWHLYQGRSRICGHADMTAQSFGQFTPKKQGNVFFLKESFTYVRTKFCFLVLSAPFLNLLLRQCTKSTQYL